MTIYESIARFQHNLSKATKPVNEDDQRILVQLTAAPLPARREHSVLHRRRPDLRAPPVVRNTPGGQRPRPAQGPVDRGRAAGDEDLAASGCAAAGPVRGRG